MRSQLGKGVLVGAVVAAIVSVTGTALAGSGLGAVFNLGRSNTVNRVSTLTGTSSGKMLQVTNRGTGSALGLTVASDVPPLRVNSRGLVSNLNADLLDGQHLAALNVDSVDGLHAQQLVQGQGTLLTSRVTFRMDDWGKSILAVPGLGEFVFSAAGPYAMIVFGSGTGAFDYFDSTGNNVTIQAGAYETIFTTYGNDKGYLSLLVTNPLHTATLDVAYLAASGYCTVMIQGVLY